MGPTVEDEVGRITCWRGGGCGRLTDRRTGVGWRRGSLAGWWVSLRRYNRHTRPHETTNSSQGDKPKPTDGRGQGDRVYTTPRCLDGVDQEATNADETHGMCAVEPSQECVDGCRIGMEERTNEPRKKVDVLLLCAVGRQRGAVWSVVLDCGKWWRMAGE
jgi:hypothetical protein